MRLLALVLPSLVVCGAATRTLSAQVLVEESSSRPWVRVGLFSVGVRGGVDLEQSGQALVGASFDVGYLYTSRLRLRFVGELGFAPSPNSYVVSFETVYRFTPDSAVAVPYIGTGLGVVGSEACGADPDCPAIWWQFVLGFDLRLHRSANWFVEYHPQDALRRQRILVGIAMRPGGL